MADQKSLADLRKCIRDAKGDPTKMATCEKAFTDVGGKASPDQGKVFSLPMGVRLS